MKPSLVETDEDVDVARTPIQERARLARRYGAKRVAQFFPGSIPTFPTTFEEARQAGIMSQTASQRLVESGF